MDDGTPILHGLRSIFVEQSLDQVDSTSVGGNLRLQIGQVVGQEGAAIEGDKIVSDGILDEARLIELLVTKPSQYPGCAGEHAASATTCPI
jgi:hypothetical protein